MFGLFNPRQVLGVIATEIEKQKLIPIEKYVMIYDGKEHAVKFQLNDDPQKLPLDNPALADGIKMYVGENVPAGHILDYAILFYHKEQACTLGIHATGPEGQKFHEKIAL
jgi:hypothetical protein